MLPILFILVAFSCATEDAVVYDRGTSSPPSARIINADEIHAIPGLESIVSKLNRRSSAVGRYRAHITISRLIRSRLC